MGKNTARRIVYSYFFLRSFRTYIGVVWEKTKCSLSRFPVFLSHVHCYYVGERLSFPFPVFLRMHIVAVGAKGSLAGWNGSSVALPKVAADDIPVLPEGAFRPLSQSHAPKVSKGRAESPLVCPQTQSLPHAPAGANPYVPMGV